MFYFSTLFHLNGRGKSLLIRNMHASRVRGCEGVFTVISILRNRIENRLTHTCAWYGFALAYCIIFFARVH